MQFERIFVLLALATLVPTLTVFWWFAREYRQEDLPNFPLPPPQQQKPEQQFPSTVSKSNNENKLISGSNKEKTPFAALIPKEKSDLPFLVECQAFSSTPACVEFPTLFKHTSSYCWGRSIPLRRDVGSRYWNTKTLNETTTITPGSITLLPEDSTSPDKQHIFLALFSPNSNINHAFHDDLWSIVSWGSHVSKAAGDQVNVTLVYSVASPWTENLVRLAAQIYGWNLVSGTAGGDNQTAFHYCSRTTEKSIFYNGFVRKLSRFRVNLLPGIRDDFHKYIQQKQKQLLQQQDSVKKTTKAPLKRKERIVIYTRGDAKTRQLSNAEYLKHVLDTSRYEVAIMEKMPKDFWNQISVLSTVDLLIAPNGGWAPNVLFLKPTTCVVELHLYHRDSWILRFGLHSLFPEGQFHTVTGDYSGLPKANRLRNPGRGGGDDTFLGHLIARDIQKALYRSPSCQRFLRYSVRFRLQVEALVMSGYKFLCKLFQIK